MTRPAALVTGANRGIGRAIVVELARRGFDVVFVDVERNADTASTVAAASHFGGSIEFLAGDIACLAEHAAIVERAFAFRGEIHALVNNAGVSTPKRGDLLDLTPDAFDAVMDVNLRGTFFLTQSCARRMLAAPSGAVVKVPRSIVTITSASATHVSADRLDYCCSKAALSMMVKGFATRLAPAGIACYEVRPGIIRTAMTAGAAVRHEATLADGIALEGRWGEPEDVARAVGVLCSGELSYATGAVLDIDGGLHIERL